MSATLDSAVSLAKALITKVSMAPMLKCTSTDTFILPQSHKKTKQKRKLISNGKVVYVLVKAAVTGLRVYSALEEGGDC